MKNLFQLCCQKTRGSQGLYSWHRSDFRKAENVYPATWILVAYINNDSIGCCNKCWFYVLRYISSAFKKGLLIKAYCLSRFFYVLLYLYVIYIHIHTQSHKLLHEDMSCGLAFIIRFPWIWNRCNQDFWEHREERT